MENHNPFNMNNFEEKEESFNLSDMLTDVESIGENSVIENFDFIADISCHEPLKRKKKKARKNIIRIKIKRGFRKHFSRFVERKKLRKKERSPNKQRK